MIKIVVCDDEMNICVELKCILIDVLGILKVNHRIDIFTSGEELCRKLDTGASYDLIFLDIGFAKNESNGVEIGHLIRNAHNDNNVSIVFISWDQGYAMQLFEIRPIDFLLKPLAYNKIEHAVKTFLKISGFPPLTFTYKKGHDMFSAQVKDIMYLESNNRKIIIHFSNDRIDEFYGSLKELYNEQLKQSDFIFCHASYLVNYDYVTAVKYDQLLISGSVSSLPISQNRKNDVRETCLAIMKRRRRVSGPWQQNEASAADGSSGSLSSTLLFQKC